MTEIILSSFSNARLVAEFDDWPSGQHRVNCKFEVHDGGKKGYRVSRTTTDKHGKWCKPKFTVYGGKSAIVDGNDGKTYILQHSPMYGFVAVYRHDFMSARIKGEMQGGVHPENDPELFKEITELLNQLYAKTPA